MHRVANGLKCLKGHHGFVVLGEITCDHQYFFTVHTRLLVLVGGSLNTVSAGESQRVLGEYYSVML